MLLHHHQQSATKHQFLELKRCAIMAYLVYATVTYTYENDWTLRSQYYEQK